MKKIKLIALSMMLLSACTKDDNEIKSNSTANQLTTTGAKTRNTRVFEITLYTTADTISEIPPTPCTGDLPGFAIAGLLIHGTASQMGLLNPAQSTLQHVSCNLSFTTAVLTTSIAGQMAAANGDLVYYTGDDEINVFNLLTNSGTTGTITGVWTITGGTGRFVGATGSITINGLVDFTTSTFSGTGLGTLIY